MVSSHEITQLLNEWRAGDKNALDKLIPNVYGELRRTADRFLRKERKGHTLQPTALVHETYLRLAKNSDVPWKNRIHFFAAAALMMRHMLVNHALGRKAQKRGSGFDVTFDESIGPQLRPNMNVLLLHDALIKLAAFDPRKSRVVELRFFGGLSNEEIADVLGVSLTTVNTDWRTAKAWLYSKLKKPGSSEIA